MKTTVSLFVVAFCAVALIATHALAQGQTAAQAPSGRGNLNESGSSAAGQALDQAAGQAAPGQAAKDSSAAKIKEAQKVAEAWLKLIDGAKYDQSHDAAAKIFRDAVAKDVWATQVKAVREPLGALKLRRFKTATFATSLPGAPDGEYVVIQFDTAFAKKKGAVETITPMLDADGKWHVSGYFIK